MSIGDIFRTKADSMKEIEQMQIDIMKQQMREKTHPGMIYDPNTMTIGTTANTAKPWNEVYRSPNLSIQITPVANGYVVGEMGCVDQFVCITMDDVKDRVIALLAAHQMSLQK